MTDNQNNYLTMAGVTLAFLNSPPNFTIISANPKVTNLLTNITSTVTSINAMAATQAMDTTGATRSKRALQKIAMDIALHICAGLKSYADDIADPILYAKINYTQKDFIRDTQVAIINMKLVYDTASTIPIASLAPFNIVATDITGLQTAINNFSNAVPIKKVMQASTTTATSKLHDLFKTLRSQFKKLDNIINTFQIAQPVFVESYHNARKIINLGKSMQARELHLMPHQYESIFGRKFKEGDTFTVRNHSSVPIIVALTDTPDAQPTTNTREILANQEFQLSVPSDFGGIFGHWLSIFNPNDLDDTNVTIILAHGKSLSQAPPPPSIA